jgi:hypothetical protein
VKRCVELSRFVGEPVTFAEHCWSGYSTPVLQRKLADLHRLAVSFDIPVLVVEYAEGFGYDPVRRCGDYSAETGLITLNRRLYAYQAVGSLAHELIHAFHRDRGGDPEAEERADRGAVNLVVPEDVYLERFDPERHLYTGKHRNVREVVDLFSCDFRTLRKRTELGPSR